jgi:chromosome segregation ATPase
MSDFDEEDFNSGYSCMHEHQIRKLKAAIATRDKQLEEQRMQHMQHEAELVEARTRMHAAEAECVAANTRATAAASRAMKAECDYQNCMEQYRKLISTAQSLLEGM